jgi:hypothetical protein
MAMTRRLNLLPWALLGLAVVAALTLVHPSSPVETVAVVPAASGAASSAAPSGGSARPAPTASGSADLTLLSEEERRDIHIRIPHEECEEGVKRVNALNGRDPTDPKSVRTVGICLAYGNVAWYKCVIRATNGDQATACSHRLLVPEH